MDKTKPPGLKIIQIFVVRSTFEHREDFLSLPPKQEVELEVQIDAAVQLGEGEDSSTGLIAVAASSNNDLNPIYRFRVEMGAIVTADKESPNMPVKEYLDRIGPAMMMPFLREAVASLTSRGRFGAIYINPINMTLTRDTPDEDSEPKAPETSQ